MAAAYVNLLRTRMAGRSMHRDVSKLLVGSFGAATACLHLHKVWRNWRALHAVEELAAEEGLPDPATAWKLHPVHVQALLREAEIIEVLNLGSQVRTNGTATVYRSSEGQYYGKECRFLGVASSSWCTTYIHWDGEFQQKLPNVYSKLVHAALSVDEDMWGICHNALATAKTHGLDEVERSIHVRTAEIHEVGPGGSLLQREHYDSGSCITIDVMLSEPGVDFTGGLVEFPHVRQDRFPGESLPPAHLPFKKGDAIVFPSHKYHCVHPVVHGLRRVLVLEIWLGEERRCPHRCHQHWGECHEDRSGFLIQGVMLAYLQAFFGDQNCEPW